MRAIAWILGATAAACSVAGCIDRRYIVETDPPGAVVYCNGNHVGQTPADGFFIYYGKYHYTITKEGYETLQVDQPISTPWYQYPILDFFAENVWPFTIVDRRQFHYQLQPRVIPGPNQVLDQAQELRSKGQAIGPPPGYVPPPEPTIPELPEPREIPSGPAPGALPEPRPVQPGNPGS